MIERTHSPGPWRSRGCVNWDQVLIFCKHDPQKKTGWPGRVVAQAVRGNHSQMISDARLIAAAPDLLSALESMVDMFERHIDGLEGPDDAADRWDAAQAAIDKATN